MPCCENGDRALWFPPLCRDDERSREAASATGAGSGVSAVGAGVSSLGEGPSCSPVAINSLVRKAMFFADNKSLQQHASINPGRAKAHSNVKPEMLDKLSGHLRSRWVVCEDTSARSGRTASNDVFSRIHIYQSNQYSRTERDFSNEEKI